MKRLATLLLPAIVMAGAWASPQDRLHQLATELRCPVCQNQTLADSHADLAVDLRREIGRQIAQGRSDEEIRQYMAQRYGDFVFYDPPLRGDTVALWAGPFALLGAGAVVFICRMRSAGGKER